jgi:hypothetical protein
LAPKINHCLAMVRMPQSQILGGAEGVDRSRAAASDRTRSLDRKRPPPQIGTPRGYPKQGARGPIIWPARSLLPPGTGPSLPWLSRPREGLTSLVVARRAGRLIHLFAMSQRAQRPPMLVFTFDGALFAFNAHRPSFELLFQSPPRNAPSD